MKHFLFLLVLFGIPSQSITADRPWSPFESVFEIDVKKAIEDTDAAQAFLAEKEYENEKHLTSSDAESRGTSVETVSTSSSPITLEGSGENDIPIPVPLKKGLSPSLTSKFKRLIDRHYSSKYVDLERLEKDLKNYNSRDLKDLQLYNNQRHRTSLYYTSMRNMFDTLVPPTQQTLKFRAVKASRRQEKRDTERQREQARRQQETSITQTEKTDKEKQKVQRKTLRGNRFGALLAE